MASFKELAKVIAQNWKQVDPVTKTYVEAVARVQKDRYNEIKADIAADFMESRYPSQDTHDLNQSSISYGLNLTSSSNSESDMEHTDKRLGEFFSNFLGNTSIGPIGEADVSNEYIMEAYHSS